MSSKVKIENNFENVNFSVEANEYDYVLSFFKKTMDTNSALNFTAAIYQVSKESNIHVFDIIKSMDGQNGLEISASLAYFLNSIRSNSSMYGITNKVKPNFYAGRAVLS